MAPAVVPDAPKLNPPGVDAWDCPDKEKGDAAATTDDEISNMISLPYFNEVTIPSSKIKKIKNPRNFPVIL